MQYPVPQFTEVEDKLIGSLSLKQFGILFVAGIFIFTGFSATKNVIVLVFLTIIFGMPALGLAFVKIGGRPIYQQFKPIFYFFTAPKFLVFHKQSLDFSSAVKLQDVQLKIGEGKEMALSPGDTQSRIKEVQVILRKQQEEEEQLVKKI